MDEYISRAGIIAEYDRQHQGPPGGARKIIEAFPAADVRPVVKAKWEVGGMFDDIGRCSNCHYMFPIDTAMTEFHFCPNCGADMREES